MASVLVMLDALIVELGSRLLQLGWATLAAVGQTGLLRVRVLALIPCRGLLRIPVACAVSAPAWWPSQRAVGAAGAGRAAGLVFAVAGPARVFPSSSPFPVNRSRCGRSCRGKGFACVRARSFALLRHAACGRTPHPRPVAAAGGSPGDELRKNGGKQQGRHGSPSQTALKGSESWKPVSNEDQAQKSVSNPAATVHPMRLIT